MTNEQNDNFKNDSSELLSALVDQYIDGIMVIDSDGIVQFANPAAQKLYSASVKSLEDARVDLPTAPEPVEITLPGTDGTLTVELRTSEILWQDQPARLALLRDVTSRARAEAQLQEQERLLRATNKMARVGGWEINLDEGTVWWSEVTREIHQVSEDFTPTLSEALDYFPGAAKQDLIEAIQRLREQGVPYDLELPFLTAKGNHLWVRAKGQAEFKSGECVRIWGTFQDITARKESQKKLQQSEEKYRKLFEHDVNGDALVETVMDEQDQPVDFVFLEVNRVFEDMLNLNREEVLLHSAKVFLPDIENTNLWQVFCTVALTGVSQQAQLFSDIHGKFFKVSVYSPAEGQVAAIFNDITDEREAEAMLLRSEQRFRNLFETMSQGVVYQNADGKITSANPAAEKILGLSRDQLLGKTSMDPGCGAIKINGEPLPGDEHPAMVVLRTGKRVDDFVFGIENPKWKETVWISVSSTPEFRDHEDQPYRVFTTFSDVTDRIRVQRTLEERVKELKCLSAITSAIDRNCPFEDLSRLTAEELVKAMSYPEGATAVVELNGARFEAGTPSASCVNSIERSIILRDEPIGHIKVCYSEDRNFMVPEEDDLLKNVAEHLAAYYDQQKTQEQLIESEKRFRTAIMNAPNPICIYTEDGEMVTINRAWTEFSGYERADIPTVSDWLKNAYGEKQEKVQKLVDSLFNDKVPVEQGRSVIRTKSGEKRVWDFSSTLLGTLPDNRRVGMSMARDITEQEQYYHRIASLRAVDRVIGSSLDLEEVLDGITSELASLIRFDSMAVMLMNEGILEIIAAKGFTRMDEIINFRFPSEPGYPNYDVIQYKQPVISQNVSEEYPRFSQPHENETIKAWLGLPLISQDGVIGMFTIDRVTDDPFTAEDVEIAMEFANRAAIAIRNAQLYEETRKHVSKLETLRKIDALITSDMELEESLLDAMECIRSGLDIDAASIFLYDQDQEQLVSEKGVGFKSPPLTDVHIDLGQGFSGEIAQTRVPLFVPEVGEQEDDFVYPVNLTEEGIVSYYGLPLISKGELIGVLQLFSRTKLAPDEDWFDFAEALAGQAAIAVDNMKLVDELQDTNVQLVKAYDATIEGWARALELRDKETSGHSDRVVQLCLDLAKVFGFDEDERQHIRRGVYLHDIGKMAIPDEILQKPGPLSETEWVVMKQHPDFAYTMLKDIDYLQPALKIPHYHHERWDGSGYPEGLRGEEIPLEARIFAVVDVWDALISDRYYREAWSQEKTVNYLKDNAGILFDPEVVSKFLELREKGKDDEAQQ